MVLATPNASDSVTITGDSAYYDPDTEDYYKGVFIANRTVILSPFKIAKYETTYELWYEVKQWAVVNGYTFANGGREGHDGTDGAAPTTDKLEPVTQINWWDVIVWCNAYSEMSGKMPVYKNSGSVIRDSTDAAACNGAVIDPDANGYRLPTEAEWEYAARGGGMPDPSGTFAYMWAGTNTDTALVNYAWYDSKGGATHPVGKKTANGLGLHDMNGNVWEWCWDWYGNISTPGTAETDPAGPGPGMFWIRMIRGGGLVNPAPFCTVSFRNYSRYPFYMSNDLGFRVVCRD
jgi:formylglycine-generating enzyme required for sulfatase activity